MMFMATKGFELLIQMLAEAAHLLVREAEVLRVDGQIQFIYVK